MLKLLDEIYKLPRSDKALATALLMLSFSMFGIAIVKNMEVSKRQYTEEDKISLLTVAELRKLVRGEMERAVFEFNRLDEDSRH